MDKGNIMKKIWKITSFAFLLLIFDFGLTLYFLYNYDGIVSRGNQLFNSCEWVFSFCTKFNISRNGFYCISSICLTSNYNNRIKWYLELHKKSI